MKHSERYDSVVVRKNAAANLVLFCAITGIKKVDFVTEAISAELKRRMSKLPADERRVLKRKMNPTP